MPCCGLIDLSNNIFLTILLLNSFFVHAVAKITSGFRWRKHVVVVSIVKVVANGKGARLV